MRGHVGQCCQAVGVEVLVLKGETDPTTGINHISSVLGGSDLCTILII